VRGGARARASLAAAAILALAAACGRGDGNPALGDWQLDRAATSASAALAVQTTELERLTLRPDAILAGETTIPVQWVVEGERVRAIRGDGRGEHAVEVLADGRIQVELPIGVRAVYGRVEP
jgi:hypothetical protein